ncbi:uncharacterized protein LOC129606393 [Condylostylus longicornis]|uniref:uncharacterized protein LOC129606393 n=1 Tax=Condylostylus longicornis TaxID=2530218 RepID=UPI00244DEBDD|nr:uncharacterized protein LOC129606393 [Condylostylus longicornis]
MVFKRGALIVLEGCDRCGKTTQSKKIYEYLVNNGIKCRHLSFPARNTPIGSIINSYLAKNLEISDESIHLLFSANRWELNKEIKDSIQNGTNLIVDRYSYSGIAFSTAKGLDYEWCKAPEVGLLKPDLVIYLNTNPEILANRGNYGEERYEKVELQNSVKNVYNKMIKEQGTNWLHVDADDSVENVFKILIEKVLVTIDEAASKPTELI